LITSLRTIPVFLNAWNKREEAYEPVGAHD